MSSIKDRLRPHLPPLALAALLVLLMTFPLAGVALDFGTERWVQGPGDLYMKYWDAWYGGLILAGQADYYQTDLLFHPRGMSLAYHNFSPPNMLALGALQSILPPVNAYIAAYLLALFANAMAAYAFLLRLFRERWIALAGALMFGLSPFCLYRFYHPDALLLVTIPLTLLAFDLAYARSRPSLALLAGLLLGFTAFIGMYIFVCLLLTVAVYLLGRFILGPRGQRFWIYAAVMLAVAAIVSLARIYPMISDMDSLGYALQKNEQKERGNDLLEFLVSSRHPLAAPLFQAFLNRPPPAANGDGYLGIVPLALLAFGMVKSRERRKLLPWLAALLLFAVLRLGTNLQIDGVDYNIALPKQFLDEALPWLFQPFWDTAYYQIGILLPLAALSCAGLQALIQRAPQPRPLLIAGIVIAAVAFEYYQPPFKNYVDDASRPSWLDWLAAQAGQDEIRLVNLPMGRDAAKLYGFYQSLNGYPQAEGLASRTPVGAYDYIESNLLLSEWRAGKVYNCLPGNADEFRAARSQLLEDGFTHILLHHTRGESGKISANFQQMRAAYHDSQASVYLVAGLDESCAMAAIMSPDGRASLEALNGSAVIPWSRAAILSLPDDAAGKPRARLYALRADTALSGENIESELSDYDVIVVAADAARHASIGLAAFRDTISGRFAACERVESQSSVSKLFLRRGYPCALLSADAPLQVQYDNGIELGNLLAEVDGDRLRAHLLWTRLPAEAHAFSLQVFDESGEKALQGSDQVFHREALAQAELDLSALPPGRYALMLIVYNYETGASVPGAVANSQTRFERALVIRQLDLDA